MSKKARKYSEAFNNLINCRDMEVYQEPERKLDVPTEEILGKVEKHIRRAHYYVPVNGPRSNHDIPEGIHVDPSDINNLKVAPASENTPRRFRVYFDTPDLDLYHGDVEIRIEYPKTTEHGHAKPYKQVIKLGRAASAQDPTFHRIEISGRLSHPIPSFEPQALDGNKKLSAFLKEHFDCGLLRPLQLLTTSRTRYYCRPGGDPETVVEFGSDRGRAMTLNGFRYPILQIEPEVLRGDVSVLGIISDRLTHRFNDVRTNLESKPTPGFRHLEKVLEGNKKAKEYLLSMPVDEFRFVTAEQCPALHPKPAEPRALRVEDRALLIA